MKINEVLKKENEKKEYMFKNRLYKVVVTQRGITRLEDHAGVAIENICNLEEVLNGDFEEVIDWSKVPVDTKILVKDTEDCCVYTRRYFAEYKDGYIYAWTDGKTSFTTQSKTAWKYGKLYEEQIRNIDVDSFILRVL